MTFSRGTAGGFGAYVRHTYVRPELAGWRDGSAFADPLEDSEVARRSPPRPVQQLQEAGPPAGRAPERVHEVSSLCYPQPNESASRLGLGPRALGLPPDDPLNAHSRARRRFDAFDGQQANLDAAKQSLAKLDSMSAKMFQALDERQQAVSAKMREVNALAAISAMHEATSIREKNPPDPSVASEKAVHDLVSSIQSGKKK
jgi:hypothetical protein